MSPRLAFVFAVMGVFGEAIAQVPTITSLSGNQTVTQGQNLTLTVSASGPSPYGYQWLKDGALLTGATSASYSKANVQAADAGSYTVVVSNSHGSVTSSPIYVLIARLPIIVRHPASIAVRVGTFLDSIAVSANSTGTISYQWKKGGATLPGATDNRYTFGRNAVLTDAGSYTVVVTDAQGSVTSEPCYVAVAPLVSPVITRQPESMTMWEPGTFSLFTSVEPTTASIQWRRNGVNIAGETSFRLDRSGVGLAGGGAYSYVATSGAGSVASDDAVITLLPLQPPKIVLHPQHASLFTGERYYGYVTHSGTSMQWYRDGVAIPGATTDYYFFTAVGPVLPGRYAAVATNAAGSVTSREAVVTVDSNFPRPVFVSIPGGRAVPGGTSHNMEITTSGSGEIVQWFKDNVAIPGATSKAYNTPPFTLAIAGTYTLQVTNAAGTHTSRPIVLEMADAGQPPLFSTQPVGMNLAAGSTAQLYVSVMGEMPISLQWHKDGVAIPGATQGTHRIFNVTNANAGAYTVVATNRNASTPSSVATLAITNAPIISRHPAAQTILPGVSSVTLDVAVLVPTGDAYRWAKDGVDIPGATNASHVVTSSQGGRYSVTVINPAGGTKSYDAPVSVAAAFAGPVFSMQPASQTVLVGAAATFTATAVGTGSVTYQWRKNGVNIAGATGPALTLPNAQGADAATYSVVASDANGSTPSANATLAVTVLGAPQIVSHPTNVTAAVGAAASFSVVVSGTPTPTVQWKKNGSDIAGATNVVYTLNAVQTGDAGVYTLQASNSGGTAVSNGAQLTVTSPPAPPPPPSPPPAPPPPPAGTLPVIVSQPTGASVQVGGGITFSVLVSSAGPVSYQWRKDGVALAGVTGSSYILTNVQASAAGRYSVLVIAASGVVASADAVLVVLNPVTVTVPATVTVNTGDRAVLAATVASLDPLVFRWARNGTFLPGATAPSLIFPAAQAGDAGAYVLTVSRPDGTVLYPLVGVGALMVVLNVTPRAPPIFTQQPAGATVSFGSDITLSARATGTGTVSYQWRKDGQPIAAATSDTLTLTAVKFSDAADYSLLASDSVGTTSSGVARVSVTASTFTGTYFGSLRGGDSWALQVGVDGAGVFVALLSSRGQAIVDRSFNVRPDGTFRFGLPRPVAAEGGGPFASRFYDGEVQGRIVAGTVAGQIVADSVPLSGQQANFVGAPAPLSGFYQAVPLASDLGEIVAISAPDGSLLLVAVDSNGVRGGRGTVDGSGGFTVSQSQYSYRGTLSAAGGGLQGVYTPAGGASVQLAALASGAPGDRLANVATRGLSGSGARVLTAGFVIGGTGSKEMLIRAVGPALAGFGLGGVLANPRLRVLRGDTAVIENDDWALGGFATQIVEAASRVGAFALPPASADAAVFLRLDPGAYTAQILSDTAAPGVALIEVYDASTAATSAARLVNLSTRGEVGRGGDVLIVGIVVSGSAPKKMLIRGIGPALTAFGVADALENPQLRLYQGTALLRENDNWGDSNDAATLATTAGAVGAFALPASGKDAALLLYLAPGSYTAQVSGVGDTTGVALIEVYDVP